MWSEARQDGAQFAFDTLFCPGFSWMIAEMCGAFRNILIFVSIACHSQGRSWPGHELEKPLRKLIAAYLPTCPKMQKHRNKQIVRWSSWLLSLVRFFGFKLSNMRCVWIFAIFASSWPFAAKWLWDSAFPACLRCMFASLGSVETQEELHCYLAVALDVCLSFQHRVTECEDMWSEARLDGVHFRDMDRYQVYKSTKDIVLHIGTISYNWCTITSNWCAKTAFS